jgi:hypothetical protein
MTQEGARAPVPAVVVGRRAAAFAGGLAMVLAVLLALRWASGLAPLSAGSYAEVPIGLEAVQQADDSVDNGQALYRWTRGGTFVLTFALTNSASVPVTLTASDPDPDTVSPFTGPVLGISTVARMGRGEYRTAQSVHIPAGETRVVSLVYAANPDACIRPAVNHSTTAVLESVALRFTVLHVFHNTQTIPLSSGVGMQFPTAEDCAG